MSVVSYFKIFYNTFFFQNSSLTWYTDNPRFTQCFEKSVLVWIPCLFLWLFSPVEIYNFLSSKQKNIPWNWLNITKLLVTTILIILLAGELLITFGVSDDRKAVYDINFFASLIKFLTVVSLEIINEMRNLIFFWDCNKLEIEIKHCNAFYMYVYLLQ